MKVELVEELRFNHVWPWYILRINGEDIYGSWDRNIVESKYDEIVKQGKFEKSIENILKSHETDVSLEQKH